MRLFPGAATTENALLLNEGLAEDTGITLTTQSRDRAARAVEAISSGRRRPSFVRSFAYASGPGYGALLDAAAPPGWRRHLSARSDLAALLASAYRVRADASAAPGRAASYDDGSLRVSEDARAAATAARIVDYRARYVDGPVLRIPVRGSSFRSIRTA